MILFLAHVAAGLLFWQLVLVASRWFSGKFWPNAAQDRSIVVAVLICMAFTAPLWFIPSSASAAGDLALGGGLLGLALDAHPATMQTRLIVGVGGLALLWRATR